jgi:hypothetical protein
MSTCLSSTWQTAIVVADWKQQHGCNHPYRGGLFVHFNFDLKHSTTSSFQATVHPARSTMSQIQLIDQESIHRICSSQVVVDLASAVKEMVENALDAGATLIEVKLKNMGVDAIEVSDNGTGIDPVDYDGIAQKHHTSKLQNFEDLFRVESFGFRGEALNALCELSGKFTVTTRLASESVGSLLTFDRFGRYVLLPICANSMVVRSSLLL